MTTIPFNLLHIYMSEKAVGYVNLLDFHKYNGVGLIRRVMFGRVGGCSKEYAVGVCISSEIVLIC